MRWIQFRSDGKFHLVSCTLDCIDPPVPGEYGKQYAFECGVYVSADPDKVAARDEIYNSGIDEYCPKCLEKYYEST